MSTNGVVDRLRREVQCRSLYIWGAGNQGRGLLRALERQGVAVSGFVDRSLAVRQSRPFGFEVKAPEDVLANNGQPRPFIVIASFFSERQIIDQCIDAGLQNEVDFMSYTAIKPFDYAIDISGVCNLRCSSCPRGDRSRVHPPKGFMSSEEFAKVIDKIVEEDPLAGSVQLYQWGEPLLNAEIGQIIAEAHRKGVLCAISSNLNEERNLTSAIAAKPDWFRLSVSGWGENYEKTHTGGLWELFYRNFNYLARLRNEHCPDMKTEVYYHLYKHNQGDDLKRIEELCRNVSFEFHPVYAYLISLDDVLDHLEGAPLPREAERVSSMLAIPLEEGMDRARCERNMECQTLRCIHINWDLSVSNCMMFYNKAHNRVADNFLTISLADISQRRKNSLLCKRCKAQALHRYCSVYATLQPTSVIPQ